MNWPAKPTGSTPCQILSLNTPTLVLVSCCDNRFLQFIPTIHSHNEVYARNLGNVLHCMHVQ